MKKKIITHRIKLSPKERDMLFVAFLLRAEACEENDEHEEEKAWRALLKKFFPSFPFHR